MNLGDEGQTFPMFLEMEKRPPNEHGTGRHLFSHIEHIKLIFIPKKGSQEPSQVTKDIIR